MRSTIKVASNDKTRRVISDRAGDKTHDANRRRRIVRYDTDAQCDSHNEGSDYDDHDEDKMTSRISDSQDERHGKRKDNKKPYKLDNKNRVTNRLKAAARHGHRRTDGSRGVNSACGACFS